MAMDANQLQEILGGVDYPVNKNQLTQYLHDKGVSDNAVQSIERMDRSQFNSPTEVTDAMRGNTM